MTVPTDVARDLARSIAAVLLAAAILDRRLHRPRPPLVPALVVAFLGLALVGRARRRRRRPRRGQRPAGEAFGGAYSVDALTTFLDLLFVSIVALTIAFAPDYLEERDLPVAEFAAVLVFAMSGAMLIAGSADLLVLFLGLELMVLPGYMLAGYHKTDGYSTEGAIKYFLLGSFSVGDLPVRARVHLGPDRHDDASTAWPTQLAAAIAGGGAAVARPRDGPRVPHDRRRVQDRRRPVPLLDAGRVPGLADAGDRLPLGRAQDRRVRADHPAVRRGARAARGRLELVIIVLAR